MRNLGITDAHYCIKSILKTLPYSTGNYVQYLVMIRKGTESEEAVSIYMDVYVCTHHRFRLAAERKRNNTVNQLYSGSNSKAHRAAPTPDRSTELFLGTVPLTGMKAQLGSLGWTCACCCICITSPTCCMRRALCSFFCASLDAGGWARMGPWACAAAPRHCSPQTHVVNQLYANTE